MNRNDIGEAVYDLISKMDDDEAEVFTTLFANEVYDELIRKNQRLIKSHNARVAQEAIDRAERIAKNYEDEGSFEIADAVRYGVYEYISKATGKFDENKHNRHPAGSGKGGRFAPKDQGKAGGSKVKPVAPVKPVKEVTPFTAANALVAGRNVNQHLIDANAERPVGENSTTDRTFSSIGTAGALASGLGTVAGGFGVPGASSVKMAGEAAKLASDLGPNAEKLVGPSVRRAKYRTQGVERKIDPQLTKLTRVNLESAKMGVLDEMSPRKKAEVKLAIARGEKNLDQYLDQSTRESTNVQAATQYLYGRLPDLRNNTLRAKSGKIAPSEGVIIDADGKIAHQSVGIAEDHYLPFSSKNLKSLKGGSYVRTRTLGGPTAEDLRTGLQTGARTMIVASHSGIFRVDFDDDFVGNARKSSRAKQMVDRYEKLLDAVQSKQVERQPLSAVERMDIEDEVDREMQLAGGLYNDRDRQQMIQDKVKEAISRPRLTREEEKEISERARSGFSEAELSTDQAQRQIKRIERGMRNAMLERKGERMYRLNGRGYHDALRTLEDEFPYFLNVQDLVQPDDTPGMNQEDTGYVKARFLHPEAEQHGYYGEGIAGAGSSKRRGDRTEYQNYRYNAQHYGEGSTTGSSTKDSTDRRSDTSRHEGAGSSDYKQKQQQRKTTELSGAYLPPNATSIMDNGVGAIRQIELIGISGASPEMTKRALDAVPTLRRWSNEDAMSPSEKMEYLTDPVKAETLWNEVSNLSSIADSPDIARMKDILRPKMTPEVLSQQGSPALPYRIDDSIRNQILSDPETKRRYEEALARDTRDKSTANREIRNFSIKDRAKYENASPEEKRSIRATVAAEELVRADLWAGRGGGGGSQMGFRSSGSGSGGGAVQTLADAGKMLIATGNTLQEGQRSSNSEFDALMQRNFPG